MTDYKPIACGDYDRFEIAILKRRPLRLIWREGNVIYDQIVQPVNLETRAGEEFLLFRRADGSSASARLDHIRTADWPDPAAPPTR